LPDPLVEVNEKSKHQTTTTNNANMEQSHSEKRSPQETLIAYENETWRLIKQKDLRAFASYLAEDFTTSFLMDRSDQRQSCWNSFAALN
jgi:hypothetical protein